MSNILPRPFHAVLATLLACALLAPPRLGAADDPVVDDTLTLMEQQAETVDTLDTVIDTQVLAGPLSRTIHMRLVMDRTAGKIKAQTLDDDGRVLSEIMVDGSKSYARGRDGGAWSQMPMDEQTQTSLESMGAQFGAQSQGGLAGLERSDGAALEAESAPAADAALTGSAAVAPEASAGPEIDRLHLLKRRHFSRKNMDRARTRIQRRLKRRKQRSHFDREARLEYNGHRVLRKRPRGSKVTDRPWADELITVDPDSGLELERSQFVHASRFGGKKAMTPHMRRLKDLLPGDAEDTDEDPLVELSRHRVLKTRRIGGADVIEEAETENQTPQGPVTVKTKWRETKVNARVPKGEFAR